VKYPFKSGPELFFTGKETLHYFEVFHYLLLLILTAGGDYALRFAKISHRMLKYAKVAVSQYWTWQNNYSIYAELVNTLIF